MGQPPVNLIMSYRNCFHQQLDLGKMVRMVPAAGAEHWKGGLIESALKCPMLVEINL